MKKTNRILSMLLSLILLFSLMAVNASAEGEEALPVWPEDTLFIDDPVADPSSMGETFTLFSAGGPGEGGAETTEEKKPFTYEHDPRDNPVAMRDAVYNPDAVYGFSPNPESSRTGAFADAIDWGNEEQVAAAEQALAKSKRQEELGQKGHADVIQMEADLADRQYDLTNTYNMYQDQKMTLADLMFWPMDEELLIDFSIPLRSSRNDSHVIPSEVEESPESVVDFALEHNPAIQIASWQQLNAQRELSTAKWQLLPTLGLYAGWSTSYYTYQGSETATFSNQFKNNGGEYVEVTLQIPLWNRMSRHSAISRRQNALNKATAELDQKRRDVESEVRRAIQDRDGAAIAYQQAQRKAEVQAEAYTLTLKKLEQGLISPLEFQTANNNYLKAQADEMNSLFKYLIKQAVVRYYNGVEYVNQ